MEDTNRDIFEPSPSKPGLGLGEVLKLSWPASLTMLNTTLLRFVDGIMVSRVGPAAFGAQFIGGMFAFIPESFAMGALTVVNTYVSQNYGAGRLKQTGMYAWAGMATAAAFCCLALPLIFLADRIFALFGHAPDVTALETMYFQYMLASIVVTLPRAVLEQFFFGTHRPRVVLFGSVVANVLNVALNYILIFGKLGLPAMGLKGSAIGSLISWVVQFLILLAIFLSAGTRKTYYTHLWRAVRLRHCTELLKVGWPAGVQLCNDIASWSLFSAALVGKFGTVHLAATTVAMRYMGLSFMPAIGIGIAATVLVGKCIGEGRKDLARRRTHAALLAGMVYMGLCGLAFYFFRRPMVEFFVSVAPSGELGPEQARVMADEIVRIGGQIMICAAIFQLFDAIGIVYIGALRGTGDTLWPMILTVALSWGMVVGGGALVVHTLPQLASLGPWIPASLYVVALGAVVGWRFETGRWEKIDLFKRKISG
ncbi:MAG: MATE family efflux transporter [Phycisphaerae bacterium]